jgi:hypothetical protein
MRRRRSFYARPEIVRGQQCAEARRRGGAGQLLSGGGQGHGAGVVTAVPSWVAKRPQTLRPGRGLAAQRVVAGREDVRTPTMPVVALSASSVRRADVRPIGRADVRCPRVRCPRDRCHPGVRTDGPSVSAALQPRCPDRAGPWNGSVRRAVPVGRNGFDVPRGPRAAWSPARIGPDGKGWCWVGRGWLGQGSTADRRPPHRTPTGWGAASPPGRQGSWSSARVLVGWLGSTRTSRCSPVPCGCVLGRCRRGARPWAGQGGGDHALWSLGW